MDKVPPASELGYRFEPPCGHDDPCHRRLIVRLRAAATRQHFDPKMVRCRAAAGGPGPDMIEITHPWAHATRWRVWPGRIIARDRVGKNVEAFTFGGALRIESGAEGTTCDFESDAPLIPLPEVETALSLLAAEAEVLLAERRVYWERAGEPEAYEKRLMQTQPLLLYATCLRAVAERLEGISRGGGAAAQALRIARRQREAVAAQGFAPESVPALQDVL